MYAYVHSSLLKVLDEDMYQRYIMAVQDEDIIADINDLNVPLSLQKTCHNCDENVEDYDVRCDNCGAEILQDDNKYTHKIARHNRLTHFMKILNSLQGISNICISYKDLKLIYKTAHVHIVRDKLKYISSDDVRCYLKECKLSKYNKCISYIKRLICEKFELSCNICTLTDDETYKFIYLYKQINDKLMTKNRFNYSLIIRKLAERVINDEDRLSIFLDQLRVSKEDEDGDELLMNAIERACSS